MKDMQYQKLFCFQLLLNKCFFNAVLNLGTQTLFLVLVGVEFQRFAFW